MKNNYLKVSILVISILFTITSCNHQSNNKNLPFRILEDQQDERNTINQALQKLKFPTVNITANDKLTSPVLIEVNSQGLWFASEGRLGHVQLVDENGNELAYDHMTTKDDWMTNEPVVFTSTLNFNAKENTGGLLIIHNDPGEGDGEEAGEKTQFSIPITF